MEWRERKPKKQRDTDVVEEARRLRAERSRLRAQLRPTMVIQALVRGYACRHRLRSLSLLATARKLSDMEKLASFLGKANNRVFVVPEATATQLVRELTFGQLGYYGAPRIDLDAVRRCCTTVIIPRDGEAITAPTTYARFVRLCWFAALDATQEDRVLCDAMVSLARNEQVKCFAEDCWADRDRRLATALLGGEAPPNDLDDYQDSYPAPRPLAEACAEIALRLASNPKKLAAALWSLPCAPRIVVTDFEHDDHKDDLVALSNRIIAFMRTAVSAASLAERVADSTKLTAKWLGDCDQDVVLRWDIRNGVRVPIVAPRALRTTLSRLLEPRLVSKLVEGLVDESSTFYHPPDTGDIKAAELLKATAPKKLVRDQAHAQRSALADVLGAKWARKLNAAISSITGQSSSSSAATPVRCAAAAAPRQAQRGVCQLCRMLERVLPTAGPKRRFEVLNCLAFHSTLDVVRALYNSRGSSECWYAICVVVRHALLVVDDDELETTKKPLAPFELRRLVLCFKQPLFEYCWRRDGVEPCFEAMAGLLRDLRARRKPIVRPEDWLVDQTDDRSTLEELGQRTERAKKLFRLMPQAVPFRERAKLFFEACGAGQNARPEEPTSWFFRRDLPHPPPTKTVVRIRRSRVFEDGLDQLSKLPVEVWRGRLAVHFVDELTGKTESGIDGGGLFKEFLVAICGTAFCENYGLFKRSADGLLYPNPDSELVAGPDHLSLFEFVGALVGKALRENVTVQPRFNRSFLRFVHAQDYNFLGLLEELNELDPDLYKNLKFLRLYHGDSVDALCLTFSVARDDLGKTAEVDLVPGGRSIPVTDANKHAYVQLVAKYHLVDRLRPQARAFVMGLGKCLDLVHFALFDEPELQHMISGADDAFDLQDLINHTKYEGFIQPLDSRLISRFWSVVKSLSYQDQARLLKFATSCERPPPLGFANLQPPFTIRKVCDAADRLPTASTCFNTLKLPVYPSAAVLKTKLLTSIRAEAGFDLS